jgi:malate dehydrogenase
MPTKEDGMRNKVTIIGAGQTGSATALWLAARDICDIVLLDVVSGLAEGKAMDLQDAMPILGQSTMIHGTSDYRDTANSDLVLITAGSPRKPGMSRDDLLTINASVVVEAVRNSLAQSPNAILIVLTNPVDPMTYLAYKVSGLPKNRVLGQGGILDSARFRSLIARELGVSVESVHACFLGAHGEGMVPMIRQANVSGIPLPDLMPMEKLKTLVERARNRGAEIISLLKTSSAAFAPGAALTEMVEAILHNAHQVLPCSAYCEGEFGLHGLYFGVPVQIGRSGIERIVELPLNAEEQSALQSSAQQLRETIAGLSTFLI